MQRTCRFTKDVGGIDSTSSLSLCSRRIAKKARGRSWIIGILKRAHFATQVALWSCDCVYVIHYCLAGGRSSDKSNFEDRLKTSSSTCCILTRLSVVVSKAYQQQSKNPLIVGTFSKFESLTKPK